MDATPSDLTILREIEGLYERNRRFEDVSKVLRRELDVTQDHRERVPILYKLGTILEDHLSSPDEALVCFQDAVRLMGAHVPARQSLGRLYGRTGRWNDLAELFEMEIRLEEDDSGRVGKLYKLAELCDAKLGNEEKAIATLRELLSIRVDYQPGRKYLERLLQRREEWRELIRFYNEDLELTEDVEQKIFLLGRVGVIAEEKANDIEAAILAYRRILELSPRHLSAIRTLARLATKREDWAEVLRMYELEADATEDQQELVAILHRAGAVSEERLQDVDAALAQYEKALSLNPTYLPALRSLGRIYGRQGRWEDLANMFERELEVTRSAEQQVALLFRIAEVYSSHLSEDEHATRALERVLEIDPDNHPAMRALAEIHERQGDGERLVDILLRESTTLRDPKEKAAALIRIAELCEERLERPDRAAELYEDVLRLGYGQDPAIHALVRIYSVEGRWSALSRALSIAFENARDDSSRAAILLRSAEVSSDRLQDLDRAADFLEQALQHQPNGRHILANLERVSIARKDWTRALAVAERIASQETDPRKYAAQQIQIASIKELHLDPPQSGAENYRRALLKVPDHPAAMRAMELAYLRANNWKGLVMFLHREALVSTAPAQRAHILCRAAEVAEERLTDFPYAVRLLDLALSESPKHVPSLRARRRLAERMDDPATVLRCIQTEGQTVVDAELARLVVRGWHHPPDRFQDIDAAVKSFEGVLVRSPSHEPSFRRLEAIYLERRQ
ncbi:MAG: tetratricopeptide repeat protein, partial [Myxococcales bacterium]|nr:tetratricopeptide repeat protein [Myxococcales bacterium]